MNCCELPEYSLIGVTYDLRPLRPTPWSGKTGLSVSAKLRKFVRSRVSTSTKRDRERMEEARVARRLRLAHVASRMAYPAPPRTARPAGHAPSRGARGTGLGRARAASPGAMRPP